MKHAREDYNRIQDPENLIPIDEPVFLLRGQDVLAPECLKVWAHGMIELAQQERDKSKALQMARMAVIVQDHAFKMQEWQRTYGHKIPDMP